MKKLFTQTLLLLISFLGVNAQTGQTFIISGSFTVPAGVTSIFVEAWGSGASGGGAKGTATFRGMGGAGGGGAYNSGVILVNPGDVITYTVAPQTAASVTAPVDGTASSFSTVSANGGSGGVAVTASTAHVGGAGGNGGLGKFNGGNGGSSVGFAGATTGTSAGAGGGGGTTSVGGDGGPWSTTIGQLNGGVGGALDGGAGARGAGSSGNPGLIGAAPGGGGSGAYAAASTTQRNGGAGARGQIRITYPATFTTKLGATTWNTASSWNEGVVPPNGSIVRIDNNINLNIPVTLSSLNLNGGKITLGSNNLSTNSVIGGTSSSFVITDGSGVLKINNIGTTAILFPVGANASTYTPATLTNSGTIDNYSLRTEQNLPSCLTAASDKSVSILWDIAEETPTGSNVALTLNYGGSSTGINYSGPAAKIVHCNGAMSDYSNGSVSGTIATGSGFTNFSPFGITSDLSVLPVTLSSFTGSYTNKTSLLKWTVGNEINIRKYAVERSEDGRTFNETGFVNATGNTEYSYTDASAKTAVNFYRLRIVGTNDIKYSAVVKILSDAFILKLNVFPSPAVNTINAEFASDNKAMANVQMTDVSGRIVLQKNTLVQKGYNNLNFDISTLNKGMYIFKITIAGKVTSTVINKL